jgi:hypothetical protein
MSWTYRVRKRTLDTGEIEYGIVECHDEGLVAAKRLAGTIGEWMQEPQ